LPVALAVRTGGYQSGRKSVLRILLDKDPHIMIKLLQEKQICSIRVPGEGSEAHRLRLAGMCAMSAKCDHKARNVNR